MSDREKPPKATEAKPEGALAQSGTKARAEPKSAPKSSRGAGTTRDPDVLSTFDRLELWDREGLAPTSFVIVLLLSGAALLYTLAPFVHDIILAFMVVGLFGPLYQRWRPVVGNRWLCSALVTSFALVLMAAPLVWLALTLFEEATQVYGMAKPTLADGSVQQHIRAFLERLGISVTQAEVVAYVQSYAQRFSEFAFSRATTVLNNLLAALLHLCVIVVLVFYMFVEGHRLKDFLFNLSPLPDDQDQLIVTKFTTVVRSVLVGNGIGSVLQGVVGGTAMALVGLPSPVLWGTVMSIAAFVPLFGISVVVVPAGIYLLLQGRTAEAIAFVSGCMAIALVLENVLKTKLMGVGVHVHEVMIFLSILGGLAAFGVLGLLYGPLIVAIFLTLTELYMTHYRPQFATRFVQAKVRRGSRF